MKTKVQVKDLRAGDVLSSGAKLLAEPCVGIKTPSGKVEIFVLYPNKKSAWQKWNKSTKVTITNR